MLMSTTGSGMDLEQGGLTDLIGSPFKNFTQSDIIAHTLLYTPPSLSSGAPCRHGRINIHFYTAIPIRMLDSILHTKGGLGRTDYVFPGQFSEPRQANVPEGIV